jgi:histidine triad (HIT) family protein
MENNCIFCKIINKEIKSNIVFENEKILAFKDLNPVSPVHVLFIPKKHIKSLNELQTEDSNLIGNLFLNISKYAKENGISENGYRIINNMGIEGGQTVFHIHFHLLAGRQHGWPPG